MRTLRLTLAYDGTRFAGWQVQPGRRTVQGALEGALGTILDETVRVAGSGRTDSGVHARAQVASLRTGNPLASSRLLAGLNALLPADLRVHDVADVPAAFHARRSAVGKEYRYEIYRGAVVPVFRRAFLWHRWGKLDLEAMRRAAADLEGTHDFTSFVSAGGQAESHTRTITRAKWSEAADDVWSFAIAGNGFLYRMVRNIVGTLVEIGRGRVPAESVAAILLARDRRRAGPTAPARGLRLERVDYPASELVPPRPGVPRD